MVLRVRFVNGSLLQAPLGVDPQPVLADHVPRRATQLNTAARQVMQEVLKVVKESRVVINELIQVRSQVHCNTARAPRPAARNCPDILLP